MTSRNATLRRWNTPKQSRIAAITLVIIAMIYRLPDFYYENVVPTADRPLCTFVPSVSTYINFHSYFTFPVIQTTVPITLLLILGFSIRANLRLFAAPRTGARLERHMTLMVLLQTFGATCIIPYTIYIFYASATRSVIKSEYRLAVENLIYQIVVLCFYIHYASGFYIYLTVSSDFRQTIRLEWQKVLGKMKLTNRIIPTTIPTTVPTDRANTVNVIS